MKSILHLLFLFFAFAPSIAHAACEDILKYVNYNTSSNFSELNTDQVNLVTFCSARYSERNRGRAASIQASYKLFSGGVSGSSSDIRREQDNRCGGNYGRDYLRSISVASFSEVSPAAIDAVVSCEQSDHSFRLSRVSYTTDSVSAEFRWTGTGNQILDIPNVSGSPKVAKCDMRYNGAQVERPLEIAPNVRVFLYCQRLPRTIGATDPDENILLLPEGQVTIATSAGSIVIPFVEVRDSLSSSSRLALIEKDIATLKRDLARNSSSTSSNLQKIARNRELISDDRQKMTYTLVRGGVNCPSGWRNLGIVGFLIRRADFNQRPGEFDRGGTHNPDWYWNHPRLCIRS